MAFNEPDSTDTRLLPGRFDRRTVLKGTGASLLGMGALAASAGTAAATEDCIDCVFLGKVEIDQGNPPEVGDSWTFTYDSTDITIEVTDLDWEDGELVAIRWFSGGAETLCKTVVKGGPATKEKTLGDTGGRHIWAYAPLHVNPKNGKRHKHRTYFGMSHIEFYYCVPE